MAAFGTLLAMFATAAFAIYLVLMVGAYLMLGVLIYLLTMFFTNGKHGAKANWVILVWPAVVLYAFGQIAKAAATEQPKKQ